MCAPFETSRRSTFGKLPVLDTRKIFERFCGMATESDKVRFDERIMSNYKIVSSECVQWIHERLIENM